MSAFDQQVGGSHYKNFKIQPTEYILANGLDFSEGNVVKYVSRWKSKAGIEDLKKARHYIDMLIEHAEANPEQYGVAPSPFFEAPVRKTAHLGGAYRGITPVDVQKPMGLGRRRIMDDGEGLYLGDQPE